MGGCGSCAQRRLIVVAEGGSPIELGGQFVVDAVGDVREDAHGLA
jgi:hypothetical protein